jgi:UDP-2,4-diacetamido-2,4,6-trideoxy-beta-L-altropyranose hydrolase
MTARGSVIAVVCSAGGDNGYGHLRRCLSMVQALDASTEARFFIAHSEEAPPFEEELSVYGGASGFPTVELALAAAEEGDADCLLLDSYEVTPDHVSAVASAFSRVVVVEDRPSRAHPTAHLLVDPTVGRARSDYVGLVSDGCACFLGPRYALIRDDFARVGGAVRRFEVDEAPRVLIAFGGTDPVGATPKVMSALSEMEIAVDVVLGGGAAFLDEAQALADRVGMAMHIDVDGAAMAELMRRADLCVGAGGGTAWERCAAGMPTLAYRIAENQTDVLSGLKKASAIDYAGDIGDAEPGDIRCTVSKLLAAPERRRALSIAGRALCDGKGAARVASYLSKLVDAAAGPVRLRPAAPSDCQVVFEWQTEPNARRYARDPEVPSWSGHQAWFSRRLNRTGAPFLIIEHDGEAAGFVRFDELDQVGDGEFEVAIMVSRTHAGRGLAAAGLQQALAIERPAGVIAEVRPENTASQRLFARVGFERESDTVWRWRGSATKSRQDAIGIEGSSE